MHIINTIGKYKVWFYPRKRIYRIAPVDQPLCIIHKDYNSLQEITDYISDKQSNIVYTDPYNIAIQWLKTADRNSDDYKRIDLLTGQYYYGIEAKKELRDLLIEMNLITN